MAGKRIGNFTVRRGAGCLRREFLFGRASRDHPEEDKSGVLKSGAKCVVQSQSNESERAVVRRLGHPVISLPHRAGAFKREPIIWRGKIECYRVKCIAHLEWQS